MVYIGHSRNQRFFSAGYETNDICVPLLGHSKQGVSASVTIGIISVLKIYGHSVAGVMAVQASSFQLVLGVSQAPRC